MAPHLNNLKHISVHRSFNGGVNERFDFLWKRSCHTLNYYRTDTNILRWHLENNDRLRSIKTCIFSYDDVHDLLPLCAKKRLTWKMEFALSSNTLESVKTWQGDAQWTDIYPLFTDPQKPSGPERGRAFYVDEHIRKEFVWFHLFGSSFTITWK
uniref:FBA_1 domain-containing protein n=1 Tax=Steinernema glaseri TaxID=37863 RepID=A0A1I7Y6R6_9BILA